MNAYTLTLYTIASGLCFCLSLVLLVFAQIRRTTWLVNASAKGVITLAVGFLGAGIGPLMPLWFTVIGMNAVLLSAGLFFTVASALSSRNSRRALTVWGQCWCC